MLIDLNKFRISSNNTDHHCSFSPYSTKPRQSSTSKQHFNLSNCKFSPNRAPHHKLRKENPPPSFSASLFKSKPCNSFCKLSSRYTVFFSFSCFKTRPRRRLLREQRSPYLLCLINCVFFQFALGGRKEVGISWGWRTQPRKKWNRVKLFKVTPSAPP